MLFLGKAQLGFVLFPFLNKVLPGKSCSLVHNCCLGLGIIEIALKIPFYPIYPIDPVQDNIIMFRSNANR